MCNGNVSNVFDNQQAMKLYGGVKLLLQVL